MSWQYSEQNPGEKAESAFDVSEPPHKTPVTSILRRDASREAHGYEIPRRDFYNKVSKKFSRPKRPPTNILQVKLQQQQVWMGQLLDFVFRHGGLQQDVSAPCPNDECGTSRAVQYIRDGLPLGLNVGAPSDDDPVSGKSLGRSCFTGRGGSRHPPKANGIVSHHLVLRHDHLSMSTYLSMSVRRRKPFPVETAR